MCIFMVSFLLELLCGQWGQCSTQIYLWETGARNRTILNINKVVRHGGGCLQRFASRLQSTNCSAEAQTCHSPIKLRSNILMMMHVGVGCTSQKETCVCLRLVPESTVMCLLKRFCTKKNYMNNHQSSLRYTQMGVCLSTNLCWV